MLFTLKDLSTINVKLKKKYLNYEIIKKIRFLIENFQSHKL